MRSGNPVIAFILLISTCFAYESAIAEGPKAKAAWKIARAPLTTRWAADVSPDHPLPEYPRPQMTRDNWLNLNGLWDYALSSEESKMPPASYSGKILVPYCYESALSGIRGPSIPKQRLWYHRTFTIPAAWKGQRVLLHFGAVNWDSSVLVNGALVGTHRGGYTAFEFDVTDKLRPGTNDMSVSAWNPLRVDVADTQVTGKQRDHSYSVFYTASTGIWQTVWLEPVPTDHIVGLKFTPDIDQKTLQVIVQSTAPSQVDLVAKDADGKVVSQVEGASNTRLDLVIEKPHLWSPSDPHLYSLAASLVRGGETKDAVNSYFAMRKISLGQDDQGRTRIFLNNKFLLEIGLLDQGYWPEGVYTAPTDEALKYDIQTAKALGYNLLRKHAKVEPQRWYYWTDKLGILVWQDMPQCFGAPPNGTTLSDEAKEQFKTEWAAEVAEFFNSPSIVVWTTFNEGWGQHDTGGIAAMTKQMDPSRLLNSATGGVDKGFGDLNDVHDYPGPGSEKPETNRAAVNGEFGGITENVSGHRWSQDDFGYGAILQSQWLATKRYQNLLKKAYSLSAERGTSAFVYTQITDVEQEINGILSYDRAVTKYDPVILAAANKGDFPSLPPNPNPDLVPTSEDEPVTWKYMNVEPNEDWTHTGYSDSSWAIGPAPFGHDLWRGMRTEWTTSDIWIRHQFSLPAEIPANLAFKVEHSGTAEIYMNGVLAATANDRSNDYVVVPMNEPGRAAVKPGENILAVHVHHTEGTQLIDIGIVVPRGMWR